MKYEVKLLNGGDIATDYDGDIQRRLIWVNGRITTYLNDIEYAAQTLKRLYSDHKKLYKVLLKAENGG